MSGAHSHPTPEKKQQKTERARKHWLEYAIFFAAVAAAFFTGRQAYLANKQLKVSRDTYAAALDTERRQLRAYVYAKASVKFGLRKVEVGSDPIVGVVIRNTGETPARDVKWYGNLAFGNTWPVNPALLIYRPLKDVQSVFYLPPGTENEVGGKFTFGTIFTEDKYKVLIDSESLWRFIVYGKIFYSDVFSMHHEVHFCFGYKGPGPIITEADVCNDYNDEIY